MAQKFDAIIIGFGKGGKTLAAHLGKKGEKVALIEKSAKMYGGTCINVGCIPSKSLVKSAAVAAAHPGADFDQKARRYAAAINEKRSVVKLLRDKNFAKLNDDPNITVIHGEACFTSPKSISITTADGIKTLSAEKIFINTGAVSVIPAIKGLNDNEHVYFSDTLMELETLPQRLVIIGGGYIGLEFASMYASFGSKVTVLQDAEAFLPREDPDIAAAIKNLLEEQGIEFQLGAAIKEIRNDGTVVYQWRDKDYSNKADAVLVATGRRPNTDKLNLAAAGVEVSDRGAVVTDALLRTTQPNIWAMGDVVGGLQFTYISLDDYRIIASQLSGDATATTRRRNVPYSVFMATPLSKVGLSETEARQAGYKIKVAVLPAAAIPKAQVLKKTEGMLKAVIDADTKKILGAALLSEASYEMINIIKLAMDLDAPYTTLRDQIFTHPTMSEALNDLFAMV